LIKDYSTSLRPAKFIIFTFVSNNEVYISIHNEEFWLQAKRVYARTDYDLNPNVRISDHIKWYEQPANNIETSIFNKQNKLLHFATINSGEKTFTVHKIKEDSTFPFPKENHQYTFPISLNGLIFFLWFRNKKVLLGRSFNVVVEYKEKDDVSIKIDKDRIT